jgi:hypothetical protein
VGFGRGNLLFVLGAICLSFAFAAPAHGLDWTVRQLQGEAGKTTMFGASCPTTSFCVVVGGQNAVSTSTNPTGPLTDWSTAYVGAGARPTEPNTISPGRQIRGVACTSPSLCVAVSFEGLVYASTNPTGGAPAWSVADLNESGANTHMYGLSCPSPSFCAAAAGKGRIVTSTNPTGGKEAWAVTELGESLELRGISCPSPSLCVAVGDEGMVVSSTNPLGGAGAWKLVQLPGTPGDRDLFGVSCPSPGLCVSGNTIGNLLTSTSPTGDASAWSTTRGGGTVQLTAASCLTTSQCFLVDNNSDVLASADPTGGAAAWSFTNLIPYSTDPRDFNANAIFGLSCPAAELCVGAGTKGKIYTITNPLVANPVPIKKKKRRGPKRPRAIIGAIPGVLIAHHGRARARFRFLAKGNVHGFQCKLDKQRFKRCKSPKTYLVGAGRHRFSVRAVGLSGLKGKVVSIPFRVFRPSEWPPGK